jgi:hypothetical protein
MKKFYLLSFLLMTTAFAWSQHKTTVLQPDSLRCQLLFHDATSALIVSSCKTTFNYYDDGALAEYRQVYYDHTAYTWYHDLQYDNHNTLIEYQLGSWGGWGRPAGFLYNIIYDGDLIAEKKMWYNMIPDWELRDIWRAYYDEYGRIVEDSTYQYSQSYSSFFLVQNKTYEYNDNEKIVTQYGYNINNPTRRVTTTYDDNGRRTSVKTEDMTDGSFVNSTYTEYHYGNDSLAFAETFQWDGEWTPFSKDIYTRNNENAVTLAEHKLWNGTEYANDKQTLYEYNEYGYPTLIWFQQFNDTTSTWEDGICNSDDKLFTQEHLQFIDNNMRKTKYFGRMSIYYTETPNPYYDIEETENMPVTVHPNPTNDIVTITGKDIAKVEVANILGQSVISKERSGDIIIDLSQQPSGIYIFNITDRNGNRCSRKVTKVQH